MTKNDEIIFTGPPLRLATRAELVEELCDRRDIPSFVFYQDDDGDEDTGEINFLNRHSFDDVAGLARLLRLAADALEGREREITVAYPAQFRK
jgi:hypothetical protein